MRHMAERFPYLAVDLGAESGRVMAGLLGAGTVELEEVHRFANTPVRTTDGLHWNVLGLYAEIVAGLRMARERYGPAAAGIGIDSWAVDYGLIDADGRLLGIPYHYRDGRTDGEQERVAQLVSPQEQYARTGIAQLPFNTLYQLSAQRRSGDRSLDLARSLLMIPDLLHYWLTGVESAEFSNATTTGALGVDGRWAADLLSQLDIPERIFLPPSSPGSVLGPIRPVVQDETGLGPVPVILPATHDTASAVAAVPVSPSGSGTTHAYISSGTWSLLGLELDRPILSEEARLAGFTNEGGAGGTYRFLTNIMGLWLLQECRRSWARRGAGWSYEELTARAADEASPGIVLDVDDPAFLHPADMPGAIATAVKQSGQRAVDSEAALARVILEGLALKYRLAIEQVERIGGVRVGTIHVVGGGARNAFLCRLTADACGRPVVAGPVEATAMGNVLVQAMGTGQIRDLAEAHEVARRSSNLVVYEPGAGLDWDERAGRLGVLRAGVPAARPFPQRTT
jgi:rhamnulokinase